MGNRVESLWGEELTRTGGGLGWGLAYFTHSELPVARAQEVQYTRL